MSMARSSSESPSESSSKRYACDHPGCEKSFDRRDYLLRHAANHSSTRPYHCPTCGKRYARPDVLKRHIMNHPVAKGEQSDVQPDAQTPAAVPYIEHGTGSIPSPVPLAMGFASSSASTIPNMLSAGLGPSLTSPFSGDPFGLGGPPDSFNSNDIYTWFFSDTEPEQNPDIDVTDASGWDVPIDWSALLAPGDATNKAAEPVQRSGTATPQRIINPETYRQITELMKHLNVTVPEQGWGESEVRVFIELFFLNPNPVYPVLHRPTLLVRGASPALLIAMACLGSVASTVQLPRPFVVDLQRKLRTHLFEVVENTSRPSLRTMQALMLTVLFGQMYLGEAQHDHNQAYHSATVTVARLAGLFSATGASEDPKAPTQAAWLAWSEQEERKRLACLLFALDTFNSHVVRHSPMLQCYNMPIDLPCSETAWAATGPTEWAAAIAGERQKQFRLIMHQLLHVSPVSPDVSPFALITLLHGLQILTWSVSNQGADLFTLAGRSNITAWKASIFHVLIKWREKALEEIRRKEEKLNGASGISYVGATMSELCLISLMCDLDAVRILAGSQNLNGRDISPEDRLAAQTSLQFWAQSFEGRQSCWHAMELLNRVLKWHKAGDLELIPPPCLWCIYIAAIVLWIFTALIEERPNLVNMPVPDPQLKCRIEPALARQAATAYLHRLQATGDPVNLPATVNTEQSTAVVAYVAFLCSEKDWGYLARPTRVLHGLLRHAEQASRRIFADC